MIQEWVLILQSGVKVTQMSRTIHVYPTYSRGNTQAVGEMLREQLMEGRLGGIVGRVVRWL